MVWLVYEREGKKVVVIMDAMTVIMARLRASIAHDMDAGFVEAHILPDGARVPADKVGKVLTARQAAKVLTGLNA